MSDGDGIETEAPVTLINVFTVPVEQTDAFLEGWRQRARAMAAQPGFRQATMYRAVHDEAELRFVNVAEWDSERALNEALAKTDLPDRVREMITDRRITARPAVYRPAVRLRPGEAG